MIDQMNNHGEFCVEKWGVPMNGTNPPDSTEPTSEGADHAAPLSSDEATARSRPQRARGSGPRLRRSRSPKTHEPDLPGEADSVPRDQVETPKDSPNLSSPISSNPNPSNPEASEEEPPAEPVGPDDLDRATSPTPEPVRPEPVRPEPTPTEQPASKERSLAPPERLRRLTVTVGKTLGTYSAVTPTISWAGPVSPITELPYRSVAFFPEGVASGEPTDSSVIIWTRTPEATELYWELNLRPDFTWRTLVASGRFKPSGDHDHCVHVRVEGLSSNTHYYYRFRAREKTRSGVSRVTKAKSKTSPIGRTRTLPKPNSKPEALRLAVLSCQKFTDGFYTTLRPIAEDASIDLVLHLGDYIYDNVSKPPENQTPGREDPTALARTLPEYRAKYQLYHTDLNLQAMRALHPLVAVWDDAEVGDPPEWRGAFPEIETRDAGFRAWFEHMPFIAQPQDSTRLYRSLHWGKLAELMVLDQRQYRDPAPNRGFTWTVPEMNDDRRTMLGEAQRDWLFERLASTDASWKLIGSPLMIAPLRSVGLPAGAALARLLPGRFGHRNPGLYLNPLQWDGYQAERLKLLTHIDSNQIKDVVALSGDIHGWFVSELATDFDDPDLDPVMVEFVGSSVTTSNWRETTGLPMNPIMAGMRRQNPFMRFIDTDSHGHLLVEIHQDRMNVALVSPVTVKQPVSQMRTIKQFEVLRGHSLAVEVSTQ